MSIKIEKNVPLPPKRLSIRPVIEKLEPGESFKVDEKHWTAVRNAVSAVRKRTGRKFVVQKRKEENSKTGKTEEVVRCWREG